ncbi:MAG: DUF1501 domain-containing protein [Bryobacteraceae bacterium]
MRTFSTLQSRRAFLTSAGSGLGAIALSSLLAESGVAGPLEARKPHHPPKAKSVIFLFMEGGPSHIDLFDPKPELQKLAGQITPPSFHLPVTSATGSHRMPLVGTQRQWKQHGQSGLWVSDWYPHIATHVDKLAVIRSCWADGLNHVGSVRQMNTGSILAGRPSLGAWTTYGLGAANRDLPAFVVLTDDKVVRGGPTNWSAGFLPASYQGTHFQKEGPPILDLTPPEEVSDQRQRSRLDFLKALNSHHAAQYPSDDELDARMESYELAYRMQGAAPGAVDLTRESEATRKLYGMDDKATARFGTNCLLARRLVEHGVRFVEVYCGSGSGWDAHTGIEENHSKWCRASDKPIAGLLADLDSRGLLHDTLVVWGGEFGRTPFTDSNSTGAGAQYGRDHNPWGFTMWMAGAGVKGGQTIGSTDAIGFRAVDKPYHVHDLHATILHLLGLNHLDLTYLHNGRPERATINGGELIAEALA